MRFANVFRPQGDSWIMRGVTESQELRTVFDVALWESYLKITAGLPRIRLQGDWNSADWGYEDKAGASLCCGKASITLVHHLRKQRCG